MKYDCNKILDYIHEKKRMCNSFSECENGCPLESFSFCDIEDATLEFIDIVQNWSDEHPEQPKLTKREYEFLTTFAPCIEGTAIERTLNGLYIMFHRAFNDEADGYRINPNLFPFIPIGEEWYFEKLLGLEVAAMEDKDETEYEEPEINPCRGCEDYDSKGGCLSNGGCGERKDDGMDN